MIHLGATTSVFYPLRGSQIWFQIFDSGGKELITKARWPEFIYEAESGRFLDFKFFAAVTFARMVRLLNSFGFFYMELVRRKIGVSGFMLGKAVLPERTCLMSWVQHSFEYLRNAPVTI